MKTAYRIVTVLMAAILLLASIPDVLMNKAAISAITYLGYPKYLLPFIGTLKILAVITILIPKFKAMKEWAFAGLVFDISSAIYSLICSGASLPDMAFSIIALLLVLASYVLYHKNFQTLCTLNYETNKSFLQRDLRTNCKRQS